MPDSVLSVSELITTFRHKGKNVPVVNGISFDIGRGEILGMVGESGCGKSVTSLSIMGLLDEGSGKISSGSVFLNGRDLTKIPSNRMHSVRGKEIAMIFQEPMTSLNPLHSIGRQIAEAVMLHTAASKREAWRKALEMLALVGIASPEKRAHAYPHMLSGGMRQRVMIAMALCLNPALLIADEPTTALDVTVQAQILELIKKLRDDLGMSVLMITHDLGVVAEICERAVVMYAGEIVEQAPLPELFRDPRHPYTEGLIHSIPRADSRQDSLYAIPGNLPAVDAMPSGCRFRPRCPRSMEKCAYRRPPFFPAGKNGSAACWILEGRSA